MKSKENNKGFGLLFFIVFLLISLWPLFKGDNPRIYLLPIAALFLILGILNSKILTPLNKAWIKFGELLGRVIAPIVMLVIFFSILTPIGLLLKLFGKDLLQIKNNKSIKSYWISRKNINSMDRQF
jgi:hypothetical protein|tara:strand:- start:337 stop:714 length:378 start_codon:yes stop_codon:yes gene_type:complete